MAAVGNIITASEYNSVVNNLNEFFADNYLTNTPTSSKTQNSKGWGQFPANTVAIGDTITAASINELINRSNLSVQQTGAGSSIATVNTGNNILASTVNSLESNNTNILASCNVSVDSTITSSGADGTKARSTWSSDVSVTVTASFASFAEARYFFNSGGQLRYSFSNNGSTNDATAWQDLFDGSDMGTLIFSINDIAQTGTRAGNVTSGSGFYELTTTATKLYDINVDISPYGNSKLSLYGSINTSGNTITLRFDLHNDGAGWGGSPDTVNGTTTIYLDNKSADSKSQNGVNFSITKPTHTATVWTGS